MESNKHESGSIDPKGVKGYVDKIVEAESITAKKKNYWDKVASALASLKEDKTGKAVEEAEKLAIELEKITEYQGTASLLKAEIEKQKAKKSREAEGGNDIIK